MNIAHPNWFVLQIHDGGSLKLLHYFNLDLALFILRATASRL